MLLKPGDVDGQVAAQNKLQDLTWMMQVRLLIKAMQEEAPKKVNITPQRQAYQPNDVHKLILKQKIGQLKIVGLVMIQQ